MFEYYEDIKHCLHNANYVHVKSEFESWKLQQFVENSEAMTVERKFDPSRLNEKDWNELAACSLAPRVAYNLNKSPSPEDLFDYELQVNCSDQNCKQNHEQFLVKKEILEQVTSQDGQQNGNSEVNMQRKHPESRQTLYKCHLCDSSFKEDFHLEAHMDIFHNEVADGPFSYGKANSKENSSCLGQGTEGQKRKKKKIVTCGVCSKTFTKKSSLAIHMNLIHKVLNKPDPAVCSFCPKYFEHQSLLDKHILSHHPSWRPFSCNICGESFALLTILQKHITSHDSNDVNIQNDEKTGNKVIPASGLPVCAYSVEDYGALNEEKVREGISANDESFPSLEVNKYAGDKHTHDNHGPLAKKSRKTEDKENIWNENLNDAQRKRRKLGTVSDNNYRKEQLFQYECTACQTLIPTLNGLLHHAVECKNNLTENLSSSSITNNKGSFTNQIRNIQLDWRMGVKENNEGGSLFNSDIALAQRKQALMEKMFNSSLASRLLIQCRFCEYTTAYLHEFYNHIKIHGI